jgi:hypothetical protein
MVRLQRETTMLGVLRMRFILCTHQFLDRDLPPYHVVFSTYLFRICLWSDCFSSHATRSVRRRSSSTRSPVAIFSAKSPFNANLLQAKFVRFHRRSRQNAQRFHALQHANQRVYIFVPQINFRIEVKFHLS